MTFVAEEWIKFFSGDRADQVAGGWRGILYANLAIIDPVAAWEFFSQPNFKPEWLDGGASRAWYLAYAAGRLTLISYVALLSLMFFLPAVAGPSYSPSPSGSQY
jgi:endo-1,3(4)-beta-glucanase